MFVQHRRSTFKPKANDEADLGTGESINVCQVESSNELRERSGEVPTEHQGSGKSKGTSWAQRNPEKAKEYAKIRYYKNRDKRLAQRKRWREENEERQRATYRSYYAKHKERMREQIYSNRYRTNPIRGLQKAITDCRFGVISVDELDRRYREAFTGLDERRDRTPRRRKSNNL